MSPTSAFSGGTPKKLIFDSSVKPYEWAEWGFAIIKIAGAT
jgi:hypothetical protein